MSETTPTFAVIAEGPTDFTVLRQVLARFLGNPDIVVNQLQPALDATSGQSLPGGWREVFRCIGSERLREAFDRHDHVIIHIDTDVCEEPYFGVSRRKEDGTEHDATELFELTRARLLREIGDDIHQRFRDRIVFAIAVDSVECWLLPLYLPKGDRRREKTVNCIGTLNQCLEKHEDFSIDPNAKQNRYYIRIVNKKLRKRKDVEDAAAANPSFTRLLDALRTLEATRERPIT